MKKKNLFSLVALATLTLGSCTNDEVVNDYSQDNAIQFGTYMGRDVQGRGAELTDDNLLNFGVFASYTGQDAWTTAGAFDFMYNQLVSRTSKDADWGYSPLKYWPTTKGDNISFFAYAPYNANSNCITIVSANDAQGAPQIQYTVDANKLLEAEDFVADALMNQVRTAPDNTDPDGSKRNVKFELQHELTRLAFGAKLSADVYNDAQEGEGSEKKTQVNIKKIEFGGTSFYTSAIYTFGTEPVESDYNVIKRGTWSLADDAQAKTLDLAELLEAKMSTESLGGYTDKGLRLKDTKLVTLFSEMNSEEDQYLFLIPTGNEKGINGVTITVEYDIVTIDAYLEKGYSVTTATKVITLPDGALQQGKAYNYVFTFYLNEIVLEAEVADWDVVKDDQNENVDWNDVDFTVSSN